MRHRGLAAAGDGGVPFRSIAVAGMVTLAPVSITRCSGEGGGKRSEAEDILGGGQVGEGDEYGRHAAVS
jgi:hypothetical protein